MSRPPLACLRTERGSLPEGSAHNERLRPLVLWSGENSGGGGTSVPRRRNAVHDLEATDRIDWLGDYGLSSANHVPPVGETGGDGHENKDGSAEG